MSENEVEWVLEDSSSADRQLKRARRENFSTFNKGFLRARDGVDSEPVIQNNSLVAQFFRSVTLQTPTLPSNLLPPAGFVSRTMEAFSAMRANATELRLFAEEAAAGVLPRTTSARLPPRPPGLPRGARLGRWHHYVGMAMRPRVEEAVGDAELVGATGPLTLATVIHLDASEAAALLAVLVRRLKLAAEGKALAAPTEATGRRARQQRRRQWGGPDLSSEEDAAEMGGASDVSDGESSSGDDDLKFSGAGSAAVASFAATFDFSASAVSGTAPCTEDERCAVRFVALLMIGCQGSSARPLGPQCGFGLWLFVALAALHMPLSPDSGRQLQQLFAACCTHLRTLGAAPATAKHVADEISRLSSTSSASESGSEVASVGKVYTTLESATGPSEIAALLTFVVILGKFFHQARPELVPM